MDSGAQALLSKVLDSGAHKDTLNVAPVDSKTKYDIPTVTPQKRAFDPSASKNNFAPTRNQQSFSETHENVPEESQLVTLATLVRMHESIGAVDPVGRVQSPQLSAPTTTISVAIFTDDPANLSSDKIMIG